MKAFRYKIEVFDRMIGSREIQEIYIPDVHLYFNEENIFTPGLDEEPYTGRRMEIEGKDIEEIEIDERVKEMIGGWFAAKNMLNGAETKLFDYWKKHLKC